MPRPSTLISKSFGGIDLGDIAAPALLRDRAPLKGDVRHPVFHDDQHGCRHRAVAAALINAMLRSPARRWAS
ncbi:MAG: hypothetical protein ACLUD2_10475 [Clostridium sp.]